MSGRTPEASTARKGTIRPRDAVFMGWLPENPERMECRKYSNPVQGKTASCPVHAGGGSFRVAAGNTNQANRLPMCGQRTVTWFLVGFFLIANQNGVEGRQD